MQSHLNIHLEKILKVDKSHILKYIVANYNSYNLYANF